MGGAESSPPEATLEGLPLGLRGQLETFNRRAHAELPQEPAARDAERLARDEEAESLAAALLAALDGQPAGLLEESLDWLRDKGLYDISTRVLEAAWSLELPLDLLGRIAEDWVGAVLFGVGDRAGAAQVARHLIPRATALGADFANDLSHLLMSWGFREIARPLVELASRSLPGDDSARFHRGILHKFDREWSAAARCFEAILSRQEDQASRWNLAIAHVALRDWRAARESWEALQIQLPPGDGDYARAGEAVPVRLPTAPEAPIRSEIVWARRLGPARVRLEGFPCFHSEWGFGEVLLVDGEPAGEIPGVEGKRLPVLVPIDRFEGASGSSFILLGAPVTPERLQALERAVEGLATEGWPAHNGSATRQLAGLPGGPLELHCYLPSQRTKTALHEALSRHLEDELGFSPAAI